MFLLLLLLIIKILGGGVSKNLLKLIKILIYLDDNLPYSMKISFDKNLRHLKSPALAVKEFFGSDINWGEDDTVSLHEFLNYYFVRLAFILFYFFLI